MANIEKIKEFRGQLVLMRKAYIADGKISSEEQKDLDTLEDLIQQAESKLGVNTQNTSTKSNATKTSTKSDDRISTTGVVTKTLHWELIERDLAFWNQDDFITSLGVSVSLHKIIRSVTANGSDYEKSVWVINEVAVLPSTGLYVACRPEIIITYTSSPSQNLISEVLIRIHIIAGEGLSKESSTTYTVGMESGLDAKIGATLPIQGVPVNGEVGGSLSGSGSVSTTVKNAITLPQGVSCVYQYGFTIENRSNGTALVSAKDIILGNATGVGDALVQITGNGEFGGHDFVVTDRDLRTFGPLKTINGID